MNASAAEWTPNFGATEWTPGGAGSSDSWEDNAAPAAPAAAPAATPAPADPAAKDPAPEEEDELYGELKQLLDAGEINESEFCEALLEAGLPVPPEMAAAAATASAKATAEATAAAETADAAAADAAAADAAAAAGNDEDNDSTNDSDTSASESKQSQRSRGRAPKPIPKNTKESKHPDPDARPHLNVVFIGHVDAGKSTIAGTVMFLTGNVDQRVIDKYEREAQERGRESWYMAYIMDTNDEERAKGKTVEVGMAHFATETKRFTVLDAPGHANYVPNMIGGAAQADVGVLVVSARKNEFEQGFDRGGQTREHAMLALTLGVSKLIVLVNKMDTCDWDQKRYKQIRKNLGPFLKRVGYKVKRDVSWVCCSGLHGDNIKEAVAAGTADWMPEKRPFLEVLDGLDVTGRNADAPLRVPILDKYSNRGTWVLGKIEQGTVRDGDTIGILPNRERVVVEEITIADEPVAFARVGESVAIKLKGLSPGSVQRGFMLTSLSDPMPCVNQFSAQLMILDLLPNKSIMTAGYNCVLHAHTAIEECTIHKLLAKVDKKGKPVKGPRPGFAKSNCGIVARIRTSRKVCLHTFEQMRQLGRFTLRDEGKTIAIGKIMSVGK